MNTDSQGTIGPHPDLSLVAADALSMPERDFMVSPAQLSHLQQRTFYDLSHPRSGGRVAVSTCLVMVQHGQQNILALVEAAREAPDGRWFSIGTTTKPLDNPQQPFVAVGSVLPKTGLNVGVYATDPQVRTLRIELADGTVAEDTASNSSLHVFVPFRSAAAWSADAIVRLLDPSGNELVSQRTYVNPSPPPGLTH